MRLMPRFATAFYELLIRKVDSRVPYKLRPLWEHPAGPKTIFFWSPFGKWTLVLSGLGDLNRPAEKLSIRQSSALATTGFIWSRYSLVITPRNLSLFTVNFLVGVMGSVQLGKILRHKYFVEPKVKGNNKKS